MCVLISKNLQEKLQLAQVRFLPKKTSSSKVGERDFLLKADVWVHEFKCSNVAVFYENLIYSFRWVTNLVTFYLYGQNILGLNHVCLGSTRNDHPGETHSGDGN